jgi:hypothetical protein
VGGPPAWQPPSGPPVAGPGSPVPPEPARSPGRTALVVGLVVVAALAVVAAAVLVPRVIDEMGSDGATSPTIAEPTMDDVLVVDDLSTEHRDGEDVDYEQVPPLGGPHDDQWLACGVYDEPLRDENAVHDLEHGTVWITHDPELSEDDRATLADLLPDNGIMSPYDGLPAPVVVTVWGVQLQLDGADDPRLELFIEEYGDGATSPEPFASCEGGLTDPQGNENASA